MKADGIIYTNAKVVEADRIDDSDSGAVPDASTMDTLTGDAGLRRVR